MKRGDNVDKLKKVPIGIEDFKEIIDNDFYYIDKTLMLRDILDSGSVLFNFTRPRRFGKTLNMSMLRYFFEKTEEDNSYLFEGLSISESGNKYMSHMGQYPVISISLKSMKQSTWDTAFDEFKKIIAEEYRRHMHIITENNMHSSDKEQYIKVCECKGKYSDYNTSLKFLSDKLEESYGKKVIVLIDEYDVPLRECVFQRIL